MDQAWPALPEVRGIRGPLRIGDSINNKDYKINLITLDCGHTLSPNQSAGHCAKCNKSCCQACLQLANGNLFCPDCFT